MPRGYFGKKYLPDPGAKRSGILPRAPGKTEIGNKALLRRADANLEIESVQGFPAFLENSDVKPVYDLARLEPNPIPQLVSVAGDNVSIAGQANFEVRFADASAGTKLIDISDRNFCWRVLGASFDINFGAAPTEAQRLVARWNIRTDPGGGAQDWQVDGTDPSVPLIVDADLLFYRFIFAGLNSGADGSVSVGCNNSMMKWNGWLLPPATATAPTLDYLGLSAIIEYHSVTGAGPQPTFPANSTMTRRIFAVRYPIQFLPIGL